MPISCTESESEPNLIAGKRRRTTALCLPDPAPRRWHFPAFSE